MKKPNKLHYVIHQLAGPVHAVAAIVHWVFHPMLPQSWHCYIKRHHVQMFVGFWVAIFGVYVATLAELCGHGFLHLVVDGVGYSIHALGAAPFLSTALKFLNVEE